MSREADGVQDPSKRALFRQIGNFIRPPDESFVPHESNLFLNVADFMDRVGHAQVSRRTVLKVGVVAAEEYFVGAVRNALLPSREVHAQDSQPALELALQTLDQDSADWQTIRSYVARLASTEEQQVTPEQVDTVPAFSVPGGTVTVNDEGRLVASQFFLTQDTPYVQEITRQIEALNDAGLETFGLNVTDLREDRQSIGFDFAINRLDTGVHTSTPVFIVSSVTGEGETRIETPFRTLAVASSGDVGVIDIQEGEQQWVSLVDQTVESVLSPRSIGVRQGTYITGSVLPLEQGDIQIQRVAGPDSTQLVLVPENEFATFQEQNTDDSLIPIPTSEPAVLEVARGPELNAQSMTEFEVQGQRVAYASFVQGLDLSQGRTPGDLARAIGEGYLDIDLANPIRFEIHPWEQMQRDVDAGMYGSDPAGIQFGETNDALMAIKYKRPPVMDGNTEVYRIYTQTQALRNKRQEGNWIDPNDPWAPLGNTLAGNSLVLLSWAHRPGATLRNFDGDTVAAIVRGASPPIDAFRWLRATFNE